MAFSEEEQTQIKYFLSYPDFVSLSQSVQLGYPSASQPLFLVEDAFKRLTPFAEILVRKALCECVKIECQMSEARGRFKAVRVGEIEMNPREVPMLRKELLYWTTRVADGLGVVANPYSQMMYQAIASIGTASGRVIG